MLAAPQSGLDRSPVGRSHAENRLISRRIRPTPAATHRPRREIDVVRAGSFDDIQPALLWRTNSWTARTRSPMKRVAAERNDRAIGDRRLLPPREKFVWIAAIASCGSIRPAVYHMRLVRSRVE